MDLALNNLLHECSKAGGSDLHIEANARPQIRVDGHLRPLDKYPILNPEQTKDLCYEILTQEKQSKLESERELDISFTFEGKNRIRANIYWQQNSAAGAFRLIPLGIPSAEELGISDVVMNLTHKPRGLILVTGPTGSGKSTTLAAMLDKINESRSDHIITVEDPIEYIYNNKSCVVSQREVGSDTLSFVTALKYILRQDPDIVLIGEMRDLETIQSAITVAETGHLVLATLHTNNAVQTVDRIIDVFPPHQQPQVRTQLSFILEGIVSQQLIPKINGGRALAMELMFPTPAIRNLIREGKTHQIFAQMQVGREETKMQTINQALAELVVNKAIDYEEGYLRCTDTDEFTSIAGDRPE
jgi:twitching motility protein PilT